MKKNYSVKLFSVLFLVLTSFSITAYAEPGTLKSKKITTLPPIQPFNKLADNHENYAAKLKDNGNTAAAEEYQRLADSYKKLATIYQDNHDLPSPPTTLYSLTCSIVKGRLVCK